MDTKNNYLLILKVFLNDFKFNGNMILGDTGRKKFTKRLYNMYVTLRL